MGNFANNVTLQIGSTINGPLNMGTNTNSALILTDNGAGRDADGLRGRDRRDDPCRLRFSKPARAPGPSSRLTPTPAPRRCRAGRWR